MMLYCQSIVRPPYAYLSCRAPLLLFFAIEILIRRALWHFFNLTGDHHG
jgi:hypothetical protein